MKHANSVLESC